MIVVETSLSGLIDKFGEFRIACLDNPYLVGKYKLAENVPLDRCPMAKNKATAAKGADTISKILVHPHFM